jgi:DNA-directed RNA polymerase subunit F
MKVKDSHAGLLTNFEAQALLMRQVQERRRAEKQAPLPGARRALSASVRSLQDVEDISEQALNYLCKAASRTETHESISRFIDALAPFQLTRAEELMLINARPRTLVEIHLIVEECEERLNNEQTQKILELCALLDGAEPGS